MVKDAKIRSFIGLLSMELFMFRLVLIDRLINFSIWAITVIAVSGYVLPLFGMPISYGAFTAVGVLVSAGVFEGYGRVAELVLQLSDDRPILYYASLPLPVYGMVGRIMLINAVRSIVLSSVILPLAALLLGDRFSFAAFRWLPFLAMVCVVNIFVGSCGVWIASYVPNIAGLSNVWMRKVFPFWFLGGFQFTQGKLMEVFPYAALLNFANPLMYATEGMRAAVLGGEGYLNVWLCFVVLALFSGCTCVLGIRALRRRLDLIA